MLIQLDPVIPLDTPRGFGYAYFLIDRSQDHHFEWVVFISATGECWTFQNPDVKLQANLTMDVRSVVHSARCQEPMDTTG